MLKVAIAGSGDTAKVLIGLIKERHLPPPIWYGSQTLNPDLQWQLVGKLHSAVSALDFERKLYDEIAPSDEPIDLCALNFPAHLVYEKARVILARFRVAPKTVLVLFTQGTTLFETSKLFPEYPDTNFVFADRNLANVKTDGKENTLNVTRILRTLRVYSSKNEISEEVVGWARQIGIKVGAIRNPFDVVFGLSNMVVHPCIWWSKYQVNLLQTNEPMYYKLPNKAFTKSIAYFILRLQVQKEMERAGIFTRARTPLNWIPIWACRIGQQLGQLCPEGLLHSLFVTSHHFPVQQILTDSVCEKHFVRDGIYGLIFIRAIARQCGVVSNEIDELIEVFRKLKPSLFETFRKELEFCDNYFLNYVAFINKCKQL